MNYRHAFHAGNFADCMKHALLVALQEALRQKPTPFMVLDTHAGIGRYDLSGDEAQRTGEWREGVGRLRDGAAEPALEPWLALVRDGIPASDDATNTPATPRFYPGSPLITAEMLRPQDRLVCCELHPEDHARLRRLFLNNPAVAVHARDGYEAIPAFLPPRDAKRGLVLIDPPFERTDEFARLADAVITVRQRFSNAIVAAWYPIKHRAPVRAFHDRLKDAGMRDMLAAEFTLRPPLDATMLNGCGLLIANPPFQFEQQAEQILQALSRHLGTPETKASVEWVVPE